MNLVNANLALAISLTALMVIAPVVRYRQVEADVKSRIRRMMLTFGIDWLSAKNPDASLDIDMDAVRKRCRACPDAENCERYLRGEAVPGHDFCPNARGFESLATDRGCLLRYEPGQRPGRRLDA